MGNQKSNRIFGKFADDCIQCGICLNTCDLLNDLGLSPGEIAQAICQDQVTDDMVAMVQRCALCGHCGQDCLVNLEPPDLIRAARQLLIQKGRINPNDYDVMLVDREWNFFSIYRDTYDIRFDDLFTPRAEALFFPGCTLACYSPELTRAAYGWLKGSGLEVGFSDLCCGKPLDSIGLMTEADRYLDRLCQQLEDSGARQVITACPNCEAHLRAYLPKVEIQSLYLVMVQAGIRLEGETRLTFHDSCPDRRDGKNPAYVRQLLAGHPQVEMASHGANTICCGSGGIVSMIDPDLCTTRAQQRMAEYAESGAETCITACMACAHRLGRISGPGQVRHCLETVFGIRVDYEQVEGKAQAMWEGVQGEINIQRLAQNGVLPLDEGTSHAKA
jgi:fumarate reductase (CoM/CoB) subunit B